MKKFLALLLALTLTFSVTSSLGVTAFAAAPATDSKTATGGGTTSYVDDSFIDVDLPTGAAFDFDLDPQGLSGIAEEGSSLDELTKGKIFGKDTVPFINYGPLPVSLSVTITATMSQPAAASDAMTFVATPGDVDANNENNVLLCVAPSKTDIETASHATSTYASTDLAFNVGTTPLKLDFALPAADYIVIASAAATSGYVMLPVVEDQGHGNALQICGLVNPKADWSSLANDDGSIGLEVIFDAVVDRTLNVDEITFDEDGAKYMLPSTVATTARVAVSDLEGIGGGGPMVTGFYTNAAKTKTAATYTLPTSPKAGVWFDVPFYFDGKTVTKVTANGTALTVNSTYKVAADKMQFTFGTAGAKTIVITAGGNNYTLTVTLTA